MKKIIALMSTLAMVLSMTTVSVFADTIDASDGSASKNVTATYNKGDSDTTVYSVTITWDAMHFTYNDGAWNPDKHAYDASWSATGNTVTVTNHSNAAINAKLSYKAAENYSGITGTFEGTDSNDTLALASAVNTTYDQAPTATATLNLSGVLDKAASDTTVGTITVALLS